MRISPRAPQPPGGGSNPDLPRLKRSPNSLKAEDFDTNVWNLYGIKYSIIYLMRIMDMRAPDWNGSVRHGLASTRTRLAPFQKRHALFAIVGDGRERERADVDRAPEPSPSVDLLRMSVLETKAV